MASYQKYKTKQGDKWMFKLTVGIDPETGKKLMTTRRGFKTKKEAQAAYMKLKQEIDSGLLSKQSLLFEDVFKEWWDIHSKTVKPSTKYSKISKFQKHILPRFGKLKMKDITKGYCQRVINEIAKEIDSVNDIKIQANLVFKYAVKMDYILKNPMEYVTIPKKEESFLANEEDERNYWTKDEVKQFLKLAKEHMSKQYFMMFYLLIYTGMRKGELIALTWDDINLNEQTININKTMFFEKGKEIIQTAKKYASNRVIDIDTHTTKLLSNWKVKQKESLLADGITTKPQYVLFRSDLRPLRLAYPNELLNSFITVYDLHRITIHGLRHTHASMLFEAGASIKEVQARLGHKDIQTTMNVYTHVTKTMSQKTAENFLKFMELE
ncbi:tyrosine-type recombinase/integrase [Cytobacillus horneckiae]|uniref:site-specific integrase n=1 Tax=Cytobacillus horneckiae TaxID=549687 RepID=UPI002E24D8B7|nr:tyrosine-type recombinase/integrase [Cytobacillus horneckiae]MED2940700.1 tyrosine-type recombinase/integrase [Cytobacillus horneckiae]